MANTLNFNKIKKTYLTVTLADEDNTTLLIGTPTKAMMDDLMALQTTLTDVADDADESVTEDLYSACAKVMSRNKNKVEITPKFLENLFDFEDIMIFFNAYMSFINNITSQKN